MPGYSSSTGSAHHKSAQSRSAKRRQSALSTMDNVLTGEGTSTRASQHKKEKPQYHESAVSLARMADCTGVTANKGPFDESIMLMGAWIDPANIQLTMDEGTSDHIDVAQEATPSHDTTPRLPYNNRCSLIEEDLAARQLTPTAIAGLHQPDLVPFDEVQQWITSSPGRHSTRLLSGQNNVRKSLRRRSTRDRGTPGYSWVATLASSNSIERDTQGMRPDLSLPSDGSYSSWIDVDPMSGSSAHRSA